MGGSPFSEVILNAREEALSGDLNRAQALSSKALQEELRRASLDTSASPINSFSEVPSIGGVAATFNVALGAGEAFVYDTSGVGANDSPYKVVQWAAQNLLFANPDPTNPRIDLIVVTPATVQTDNAVRNILLDPVARTFSPSSVPKTVNPTVVPVVVTGAAGATPAAPAVPAGAFALYEVYVPAATADATGFSFIQRLFRKAAYPYTGCLLEEPVSGVLRGCSLVYSGTFETFANSGTGNENQVVIEGEVISFKNPTTLNVNDSLANPFAVAAPAGNDVPYYIYVCGGRGKPQNNGAYPVILISSLTPPDVKSGRPTSALGTPRGNTQSAVYVGLGFVRKGTTNHQVCRAVKDMVWCATSLALDLYFEASAALAVGTTNVTFASAPSISDEMVMALTPHTGAAGLMTLGMNAIMFGWSKSYAAGIGTVNDGLVALPINAGGPHIAAGVGGAGNTLVLGALAYRANVRRLG